MYYSIFDPYDEKYDIFLHQLNNKENLDNKKLFDEEDLCCIICLETDASFNKIKNMQSITDIKLFCNCNIYIHKYCLESWMKKRNTCPICLTKITQIDSIFKRESINKIVIFILNDVILRIIKYIMITNVIIWTFYNIILIHKIMGYIQKDEFTEIEE